MAKLSFYGGVETVTGANFLLEIPNVNGSLKILVDCGLVQGKDFAENLNRAEFPYEPTEIDFLLITHSHIDHIGRIPKLVKDGFKGRIISTEVTKELAALLLADTVHILDTEARHKGILPIFSASDLPPTFELWDTITYHQKKDLNEEVSIFLKDAGHILGSAMIEISRKNKETGQIRKVVFTGDLGNSPSLLLKDTEEITDVNYIIMESVYGDRNHESKDDRKNKLQKTVENIVKYKKTLIIPAFSVERSQMIIYELNEIFENHIIKERVPVFLDSPLAIKVTDIYKKYQEYFNDKAKADIASGDDIFNFPGLKFIVQSGESKLIQQVPGPKIIIAGSGMSVGGRVIFHENHYVSNSNATILFVGYQSAGSLGRKLKDGAKEVEIFGEKKVVKAEIDSISGYSSHKDSDNLLNFIAKASESDKLDKVFCVMGEPKSALYLVQKIKDNIGVEAIYPTFKETIEIDL